MDHCRHRAGNVALLLAVASILLLTACQTATESTLPGAGLVTAFGAQAPTQEIEQIYYLGVYDPQQQIPEAVYRIRVHGQASVISLMRFASGWVPAKFIDSLNTSVGFGGAATQPTITTGDPSQTGELNVGRRLILFGPQGFREAPADQRLVIIMGASPEDFFKAMDLATGAVAQATHEQLNAAYNQQLFKSLAQAQSDEEQLKDTKNEVDDELGD